MLKLKVHGMSVDRVGIIVPGVKSNSFTFLEVF